MKTKNWNSKSLVNVRKLQQLSDQIRCHSHRVVLGLFLLFGGSFLTQISAQPYIATSQNFFCAGQLDPVSLYCNVLAFDPTTNVADWTFEWTPAGEVSDPYAQSVTVNPIATTVYSAVMTSPTGDVFLDDISITVYPDFEVDGGPDLLLCSTLGASLVASVDISNPVTWQWQPAVGLSNALASNPQMMEELSQVYTVTATIDGLGATGCFATDVVEVVSIFPDMELGTDVVACAGDLVTIDPELPRWLNLLIDLKTGEDALQS